MRLGKIMMSSLLGVLLAVTLTTAAQADDSGLQIDGRAGDVKLVGRRDRNKPGQPSTRRRSPGKSDAARLRENQRQTDRYFAYTKRRQEYDACTAAGRTGCVAPGKAVDLPDLIARGQIDGAPVITPQQAAIVAVAELHLTPPKPGIGPSPNINDWHIAAVGYPYWLWAEGNLNPAPVSTTVGPLTVRLQAHLASTTFDLGDGTRITCTDLTRRWTPSVEPGAASPACGHVYTEPSLPKGKYTVTAYSTWAVDWSVNGIGGTIPLYQDASTTLPVGELQVLTR